MTFKPGNLEAAKRKTVGRPKKLLRTIREIIGDDQLENLIKKAFLDAAKFDGPSRAWFLGQMKPDHNAKLPSGLPPLNGFAGYMAALDAIGQRAKAGSLTIAAADQATALIERLALARASILAKSAPVLDRHVAQAIEDERRARQAPLQGAVAVPREQVH